MNTKELRSLYKFESLKVSDELKMNLFIYYYYAAGAYPLTYVVTSNW
jgi:hypothetical protein